MARDGAAHGRDSAPTLGRMTRNLLFLLFAAAVVTPQDANPPDYSDIVGTWDMKTTKGQRTYPATMVLRVGKDGRLAGVWKAMSRDMELSRLTYKDGVLRFERQFGTRTVAFTGKVKDGKIDGAHITGMEEIPSTGRRLTKSELTDPDKEYDRNSMRAAPRDAFKVLDNPKMAPAKSANLADEEFVIGVVVNGEAKAYSVRVMGSHELVNDVCGKEPIAASW